MACRQCSSVYLPTAKAASPASRIYLGAGAIRRSLGPGTSNWHSTPTKTFTADKTLNVCQKINRPVMIARSWRNRDGGRAKVQVIFARAWLFTRTRAWSEVAGGRQVADNATNKFNQRVLRLVSFNWMSFLRQMPYFDLRHSDFFFTPARDLYRRCGS